MKVLVIGNSHLNNFLQALKCSEKMELYDDDLVFAPTPLITNSEAAFSFNDPFIRFSEIQGEPSKQAIYLDKEEIKQCSLIIVGNGVLGHYAVFTRASRHMPYTVMPEGGVENTHCYREELLSLLVSQSCFKEATLSHIHYHLLARWGLTKDFLRLFKNIAVFSSPTPQFSFFQQTLHCAYLEEYINSGMLSSFIKNYQTSCIAYSDLVELDICWNFSKNELNYQGITRPEFALDEGVQVHSSVGYWKSRLDTFQSNFTTFFYN